MIGIMIYSHERTDRVSTSPDPCDREACWFCAVDTCCVFDNLWQEVVEGGEVRGLYSRVDGIMYTKEDAERL